MSKGLREAYETTKSWNYSDGPHQHERTFRQCFCVGPQNGNPVCPCRMSALTIKDGRFVELIDHGPAPNGGTDTGDEG